MWGTGTLLYATTADGKTAAVEFLLLDTRSQNAFLLKRLIEAAVIVGHNDWTYEYHTPLTLSQLTVLEFEAALRIAHPTKKEGSNGTES